MRAQEGKVTARGELSVFVLYVSDDEANPLQWLEQTMTFSGELSCTGCTMDMIPYIDTTMLQSSLEIKPDADGEERVFLVDVVLELDIRLYRKKQKRYFWISIRRNWNVFRGEKRRCWNSW